MEYVEKQKLIDFLTIAYAMKAKEKATKKDTQF